MDAMTFEEMDEFIAEHEDVVCPDCGKHDFTPIRKFNLMFKTFQRRYRGFQLRHAICVRRPRRASSSTSPTSSAPPAESCPSASARWARPSATRSPRATSPSVPVNLSRWSCEFFCKPGTDLEWFAYWKDYCKNWLLSLGIKEENLRLRDHEPAELAFYSRATTDIEYAFPFADWGELWGIADRTDYDLGRHQEAIRQEPDVF